VTGADGELVGVVPRSRLLAVLGEPMTPAELPQDVTTTVKKVAADV
jgi:glycine betaine/proline transport system ATP-binding protein